MLMKFMQFRQNKQEDKDMAIFNGSGVAIVTPFNEDNQIHVEKLKELVMLVVDTTSTNVKMTNQKL